MTTNPNIKKETFEDRFARRRYCQRAARDYTKYAKKYNRKLFRRKIKNTIQENLQDLEKE